MPKGHFARIDPLNLGQDSIEMRPITANEILMETAPVAGVSGLVFPGNRVDLFLIHQPNKALPYADLLAQDVRALAVGSEMNSARDKPGLVKTTSVALNPVHAQKLTLAITTGEIRLSLRPFRDKAEARLQTLQVSDRSDHTTRRLMR